MDLKEKTYPETRRKLSS